jgi:HAD superfamily hydrolase (TIGR01509 family)
LALADAVPAPRLVIFDCDGVLVDSEPISNRVLAAMLTREGLQMSGPQSRARHQGMLLEDIVSGAERALGRALPAGWPEDYERERDEAFATELAAVPGARDAVERVRAGGAAACVASQGRLRKTRRSLQLTGLADLFDDEALFSAEQVARGKPHPDLFLYAAASMGFAPASCAVVEDTPSGVVAAVAAGMTVLGFAADSDADALRAAGARVVVAMADVPAGLGLDSIT